MASESRFNVRAPAPSPITNPLAFESNGVECVAERAPIALNFANVAGSIVRSLAPAIIMSTWRVCNNLQASRIAAKVDAQAASVE